MGILNSTFKVAGLFFALLFLHSFGLEASGASPLSAPSLLCGIQPESCTASFEADTEWEENHPNCSVSVSVSSCEDTPEATVTGSNCYPTTGTEVLGKIEVRNGSSLIKIYELRSVDGNLEEILIWEF